MVTRRVNSRGLEISVALLVIRSLLPRSTAILASFLLNGIVVSDGIPRRCRAINLLRRAVLHEAFTLCTSMCSTGGHQCTERHRGDQPSANEVTMSILLPLYSSLSTALTRLITNYKTFVFSTYQSVHQRRSYALLLQNWCRVRVAHKLCYAQR